MTLSLPLPGPATRRVLRRLVGATWRPLPPMPGALALGAEEERALRRVIRSQRLTRDGNPWQTPSEAEELERRLAASLETDRCLVVSSGTAALHCALVGLGIGPGDEVIVPAYGWLTTATTVCNAGAVPVIADIDATLGLDPASVEAALSPFTRAIIAVHMRGAPARMDALEAIGRRHGVALIEDVAQAMGGRFDGRRLGTIGDVGCFSMQTYKLVCVGEGGAVVARDRRVFERMRAFHGDASLGGVNLPLNYGMSELAAAIGCVQLARLDGMLERMRRIRSRLAEVLSEIAAWRPLCLREDADGDGDTGTSLIFFERTPDAADRTCSRLRRAGIGCSRPYRPGVPDLHVYAHWDAILEQRPLSPYGGPWRFARREIRYSREMCPRALDLLGRAVEISIVPQYGNRDVGRIVRGMRRALTGEP